MTSKSRGRGRPPGPSSTREDILQVARTAFATSGFEQTSVRQIARAAGVDSALVHHHFGTKAQLFRESVQFPVDPKVFATRLKQGPPEQIGYRLVRLFLEVWDNPESGPAVAAVLRSALASDDQARLIREFLQHYLFPNVLRQVVGDLIPAGEVPKRAALAATQLIGLAVIRYFLKLEPVASESAEQLASRIGPGVQRYFTMPLE